eukprot:TRINITY_DN5017_c0_g1_i2.p1 TRINITY_DN5017_c0_g1~~TRINITY_DN5017_c0_g1_i2.p1  ORF type:complete len:195 (-),score=31.37 TRINITY_DN5017_c0_g1_i2:84-668(-)
MNYFEQAKNLEDRTKKAWQMTKRKQAELIQNYKSGIDRQNQLTYQLREDKQNERDMREQIRKDYQFQNPSASDQKIDAVVFRIAYERKNLKQVDDDIEFGTKKPFYPNLSKTLKPKVTKKYYHSGVWQIFYAKPNKLSPLSISQRGIKDLSNSQEEKKNYEAWSCCMNQDRNSEGCCLIKKDAQRWNYESIKHY